MGALRLLGWILGELDGGCNIYNGQVKEARQETDAAEGEPGPLNTGLFEGGFLRMLHRARMCMGIKKHVYLKLNVPFWFNWLSLTW